MKTRNKILSIIAVVISAFMIFGSVHTAPKQVVEATASATYSQTVNKNAVTGIKAGQYIEFGEYPQTEVKNTGDLTDIKGRIQKLVSKAAGLGKLYYTGANTKTAGAQLPTEDISTDSIAYDAESGYYTILTPTQNYPAGTKFYRYISGVNAYEKIPFYKLNGINGDNISEASTNKIETGDQEDSLSSSIRKAEWLRTGIETSDYFYVYDQEETANGYTSGTEYIFVVEPIKWRIHSISGDNATLMSDLIIDSMPLNLYASQGSNWAESLLRNWLNYGSGYTTKGTKGGTYNLPTNASHYRNYIYEEKVCSYCGKTWNTCSASIFSSHWWYKSEVDKYSCQNNGSNIVSKTTKGRFYFDGYDNIYSSYMDGDKKYYLDMQNFVSFSAGKYETSHSFFKMAFDSSEENILQAFGERTYTGGLNGYASDGSNSWERGSSYTIKASDYVTIPDFGTELKDDTTFNLGTTAGGKTYTDFAKATGLVLYENITSVSSKTSSPSVVSDGTQGFIWANGIGNAYNSKTDTQIKIPAYFNGTKVDKTVSLHSNNLSNFPYSTANSFGVVPTIKINVAGLQKIANDTNTIVKNASVNEYADGTKASIASTVTANGTIFFAERITNQTVDMNFTGYTVSVNSNNVVTDVKGTFGRPLEDNEMIKVMLTTNDSAGSASEYDNKAMVYYFSSLGVDNSFNIKLDLNNDVNYSKDMFYIYMYSVEQDERVERLVTGSELQRFEFQIQTHNVDLEPVSASQSITLLEGMEYNLPTDTTDATQDKFWYCTNDTNEMKEENALNAGKQDKPNNWAKVSFSRAGLVVAGGKSENTHTYQKGDVVTLRTVTTSRQYNIGLNLTDTYSNLNSDYFYIEYAGKNFYPSSGNTFIDATNYADYRPIFGEGFTFKIILKQPYIGQYGSFIESETTSLSDTVFGLYDGKTPLENYSVSEMRNTCYGGSDVVRERYWLVEVQNDAINSLTSTGENLNIVFGNGVTIEKDKYNMELDSDFVTFKNTEHGQGTYTPLTEGDTTSIKNIGNDYSLKTELEFGTGYYIDSTKNDTSIQFINPKMTFSYATPVLDLNGYRMSKDMKYPDDYQDLEGGSMYNGSMVRLDGNGYRLDFDTNNNLIYYLRGTLESSGSYSDIGIKLLYENGYYTAYDTTAGRSYLVLPKYSLYTHEGQEIKFVYNSANKFTFDKNNSEDITKYQNYYISPAGGDNFQLFGANNKGIFSPGQELRISKNGENNIIYSIDGLGYSYYLTATYDIYIYNGKIDGADKVNTVMTSGQQILTNLVSLADFSYGYGNGTLVEGSPKFNLTFAPADITERYSVWTEYIRNVTNVTNESEKFIEIETQNPVPSFYSKTINTGKAYSAWQGSKMFFYIDNANVTRLLTTKAGNSGIEIYDGVNSNIVAIKNNADNFYYYNGYRVYCANGIDVIFKHYNDDKNGLGYKENQIVIELQIDHVLSDIMFTFEDNDCIQYPYNINFVTNLGGDINLSNPYLLYDTTINNNKQINEDWLKEIEASTQTYEMEGDNRVFKPIDINGTKYWMITKTFLEEYIKASNGTWNDSAYEGQVFQTNNVLEFKGWKLTNGTVFENGTIVEIGKVFTTEQLARTTFTFQDTFTELTFTAVYEPMALNVKVMAWNKETGEYEAGSSLANITFGTRLNVASSRLGQIANLVGDEVKDYGEFKGFYRLLTGNERTSALQGLMDNAVDLSNFSTVHCWNSTPFFVTKSAEYYIELGEDSLNSDGSINENKINFGNIYRKVDYTSETATKVYKDMTLYTMVEVKVFDFINDVTSFNQKTDAYGYYLEPIYMTTTKIFTERGTEPYILRYNINEAFTQAIAEGKDNLFTIESSADKNSWTELPAENNWAVRVEGTKLYIDFYEVFAHIKITLNNVSALAVNKYSLTFPTSAGFAQNTDGEKFTYGEFGAYSSGTTFESADIENGIVKNSKEVTHNDGFYFTFKLNSAFFIAGDQQPLTFNKGEATVYPSISSFVGMNLADGIHCYVSNGVYNYYIKGIKNAIEIEYKTLQLKTFEISVDNNAPGVEDTALAEFSETYYTTTVTKNSVSYADTAIITATLTTPYTQSKAYAKVGNYYIFFVRQYDFSTNTTVTVKYAGGTLAISATELSGTDVSYRLGSYEYTFSALDSSDNDKLTNLGIENQAYFYKLTVDGKTFYISNNDGYTIIMPDVTSNFENVALYGDYSLTDSPKNGWYRNRYDATLPATETNYVAVNAEGTPNVGVNGQNYTMFWGDKTNFVVTPDNPYSQTIPVVKVGEKYLYLTDLLPVEYSFENGYAPASIDKSKANEWVYTFNDENGDLIATVTVTFVEVDNTFEGIAEFPLSLSQRLITVNYTYNIVVKSEVTIVLHATKQDNETIEVVENYATANKNTYYLLLNKVVGDVNHGLMYKNLGEGVQELYVGKVGYEGYFTNPFTNAEVSKQAEGYTFVSESGDSWFNNGEAFNFATTQITQHYLLSAKYSEETYSVKFKDANTAPGGTFAQYGQLFFEETGKGETAVAFGGEISKDITYTSTSKHSVIYKVFASYDQTMPVFNLGKYGEIDLNNLDYATGSGTITGKDYDIGDGVLHRGTISYSIDGNTYKFFALEKPLFTITVTDNAEVNRKYVGAYDNLTTYKTFFSKIYTVTFDRPIDAGDAIGATNASMTISVNMPASTTLNKYTVNFYDVEYSVDGNKVITLNNAESKTDRAEITTAQYTHGVAFTQPEWTKVPYGYTFEGWSTKVSDIIDQTGTEYYCRVKASIPPTCDNLDLYAVYTPVEVTVSTGGSQSGAMQAVGQFATEPQSVAYGVNTATIIYNLADEYTLADKLTFAIADGLPVENSSCVFSYEYKTRMGVDQYGKSKMYGYYEITISNVSHNVTVGLTDTTPPEVDKYSVTFMEVANFDYTVEAGKEKGVSFREQFIATEIGYGKTLNTVIKPDTTDNWSKFIPTEAKFNNQDSVEGWTFMGWFAVDETTAKSWYFTEAKNGQYYDYNVNYNSYYDKMWTGYNYNVDAGVTTNIVFYPYFVRQTVTVSFNDLADNGQVLYKLDAGTGQYIQYSNSDRNGKYYYVPYGRTLAFDMSGKSFDADKSIGRDTSLGGYDYSSYTNSKFDDFYYDNSGSKTNYNYNETPILSNIDVKINYIRKTYNVYFVKSQYDETKDSIEVLERKFLDVITEEDWPEVDLGSGVHLTKFVGGSSLKVDYNGNYIVDTDMKLWANYDSNKMIMKVVSMEGISSIGNRIVNEDIQTPDADGYFQFAIENKVTIAYIPETGYDRGEVKVRVKIDGVYDDNIRADVSTKGSIVFNPGQFASVPHDSVITVEVEAPMNVYDLTNITFPSTLTGTNGISYNFVDLNNEEDGDFIKMGQYVNNGTIAVNFARQKAEHRGTMTLRVGVNKQYSLSSIINLVIGGQNCTVNLSSPDPSSTATQNFYYITINNVQNDLDFELLGNSQINNNKFNVKFEVLLVGTQSTHKDTGEYFTLQDEEVTVGESTGYVLTSAPSMPVDASFADIYKLYGDEAKWYTIKGGMLDEDLTKINLSNIGEKFVAYNNREKVSSNMTLYAIFVLEKVINVTVEGVNTDKGSVVYPATGDYRDENNDFASKYTFVYNIAEGYSSNVPVFTVTIGAKTFDIVMLSPAKLNALAVNEKITIKNASEVPFEITKTNNGYTYNAKNVIGYNGGMTVVVGDGTYTFTAESKALLTASVDGRKFTMTLNELTGALDIKVNDNTFELNKYTVVFKNADGTTSEVEKAYGNTVASVPETEANFLQKVVYYVTINGETTKYTEKTIKALQVTGDMEVEIKVELNFVIVIVIAVAGVTVVTTVVVLIVKASKNKKDKDSSGKTNMEMFDKLNKAQSSQQNKDTSIPKNTPSQQRRNPFDLDKK